MSNEVKIYSSGMLVSAATVISGAYLSAPISCGYIGEMTPWIGGMLEGNCDSAYVSSGGTAIDTTLEGCQMTVLSGGTAIRTVVGDRYCDNGYGTQVSSCGVLYVESGGTLAGGVSRLSNSFSPMPQTGGGISVASGAIIQFSLENSFYGFDEISGWENADCCVTVDGNQNTGSYTLAEWDMWGAVSSYPTVSVQNTSGEKLFTISVGETKKYAQKDYTLIGSGQSLTLSIEDSLSDQVKLYSSGVLVSSATVMTGATVASDGCNSMFISEGGTATQTTVTNRGSAYVSGGTMVSTTLESKGVIEVSSGGYIESTRMLAGLVNVSGGGSAVNTIVTDYRCSLNLESGGVLKNTTVGSGANLTLNGIHSGTLAIDDEANVYVGSGTVIDFTVAEQVDSGSVLLNNWSLLSGGADASYTITVNADQGTGKYFLAQGAENFNNTVTVKTTDGTEIGKLSVGGSSFIFNSCTYSLVRGEGNLGLQINSGSSSLGPVISDYYHINDGDTLDNATVISGGYLGVVDGTINNTTVSSGGSANLSFSGTANQTGVSGGTLYLVRGTANSTTVFSGGLMRIYGGFANHTIVSSGGYLEHHENGSGGGRGVTQATVVSSGGKFVMNGDEYKISATDTLLLKGGLMTMQNLSFADKTVISGGTLRMLADTSAAHTEIYSGGVLKLEGLAADTTVAAGGALFVGFNGVAENITINGGGVYVATGGEIKGTVTIAQSGGLYLYGGSVVDGEIHAKGTLFVDETMVNNGKITIELNEDPLLCASIGNLDYMTNTENFTVETGSAGLGTYLLASGAAGYSGTVTVENGGEELGTLSVGGTFTSGDTSYTLERDSDSLKLLVGSTQKITATEKGISWGTSGVLHTVEYSTDAYTHGLRVQTTGSGIDTFGLPQGSYAWRMKTTGDWYNGSAITAQAATSPRTIASTANGVGDVFFGNAAETWDSCYLAQHLGSGAWKGTGEYASLEGKNKITDVFAGSTDANILVLTDDENGDALFVDDIYSAFPETQQARLSQIDEIRAGAGNDVVDLTSQNFNYTNGVTLRGGDGDDVLWANCGENMLLGDAGNDRIVGASGNDVIAGGSGDDSMHGGGGEDIFCFCADWGCDTVEQLFGGSVTLWFTKSGGTWDQTTLTYTQGNNSVSVKGALNVTLKYGDDGSEQYDAFVSAGTFDSSSTYRIFEEQDKGKIAVL